MLNFTLDNILELTPNILGMVSPIIATLAVFNRGNRKKTLPILV
jgi:hypothetical protein